MHSIYDWDLAKYYTVLLGTTLVAQNYSTLATEVFLNVPAPFLIWAETSGLRSISM